VPERAIRRGAHGRPGLYLSAASPLLFFESEVRRMKWFTVPIAVGLALAAAPRAAAQAPQASAMVAFRNELPGTYELRRVRLWVDGALVHEGSGPFNASLSPGKHIVSIAAEYRMQDPLLPYVRGYAIQLRSAEHIQAGHPVVVRAQEWGGVTTPIERRAHIAWR
jgi:hypothetical protein